MSSYTITVEKRPKTKVEWVAKREKRKREKNARELLSALTSKST